MYVAKVNWFDESKEEDVISTLITFGENWNEAMQTISNEFECMNSIDMTEIFPGENVLYIPEDVIDSIIQYNM